MLTPKIFGEISKNSTFWIAYSGGIDSHVLLHLAAELQKTQPEFKLKAIHINHHISPNADAWALHCTAVCKALNIPLHIRDVHLTQRKELGLEAAARMERYRVFSELLAENGVLLTGHNANDQAETLLLQLLRGAGPKGLAAMPAFKALGKAKLWRPLLDVPRCEIEAYAKENSLVWIEDESNFSEDYARNFLRLQIMPGLQEQWPGCLNTLARSAVHCAEASYLLEELAQEDLIKVQAAQPNQIYLSELKKLSVNRQANVLRYWFAQLGFAIPETKQLDELRHQLFDAKHDAQPLVCWSGVECRRFADCLYVMAPLKALSKKCYLWPEERELLLSEIGVLDVRRIEQRLRKLENFEKRITIRFRVGGERCTLPGRKGTRELKKLFQEWKIPPWERDHLPLIYASNLLIELVGDNLCSSESRSLVFSVGA